MFGKNKVASPFREQDGSLLVNELFYTIQGEGPDAGRTAIFLRLSKCNLRCFFCDTNFEAGERYDVGALGLKLKLILQENPSCKLLVITGGEPMLQNIAPITRTANNMGLDVSVETAGTVWFEGMRPSFGITRNKIICSPKTPKVHAELIHYVDAWKYIIGGSNTSPDDGLPILSTQAEGKVTKLFRPPAGHPGEIYVQAMDEYDVQRNERNVALTAKIAMQYGYRMSVQMHKLAGVP